VTTAVSHSSADSLYYRGQEVSAWSRDRSLEDGLELVLGARPDRAATPWPTPGLPPAVPLERRVSGVVTRLAEAGWGRTTRPEEAAREVARVYPVLVDALALHGIPDRSPRLSRRVVANLTGRTATDDEVRAVDLRLVQLLDHGLTASTTATRAAASARAGIADCLLAGYAALTGWAHGRASERVHQLLRAELAGTGTGTPPAGAPGFGHFLYTDGDPRADVALAAWEAVPEAAPALAALQRIREQLPGGRGSAPNIDSALAVATVALGVPAEAGTALFTLARTAGLAAHAAEEYGEDLLRWRGRAATRASGPGQW
jgi:citrate synthase